MLTDVTARGLLDHFQQVTSVATDALAFLNQKRDHIMTQSKEWNTLTIWGKHRLVYDWLVFANNNPNNHPLPSYILNAEEFVVEGTVMIDDFNISECIQGTLLIIDGQSYENMSFWIDLLEGQMAKRKTEAEKTFSKYMEKREDLRQRQEIFKESVARQVLAQGGGRRCNESSQNF